MIVEIVARYLGTAGAAFSIEPCQLDASCATVPPPPDSRAGD